MTKKIGALWNNKSDNERAPKARGEILVRDKELAKQVCDAIMSGTPLYIVLWQRKKEPESRRPDWDIALDEKSAHKNKNIPENDIIMF